MATNADVQPGSRHSLSAVLDGFQDFREGEIEPTLNKTIAKLIIQDVGFIVFIDEEGYVEWSTNSHYEEFAEDFGAVISRVGYIESLAESLPPSSRAHVARLLGESVGRVLDDRHSKAALPMLDKAESVVNAPARFRYIVGALGITVPTLAALTIAWVWRETARGAVGADAFDVALAGCMGAIGATLSMIQRSASLGVDPAGSRLQQFVEGAYRTAVGILGGFLIALAIKADLMLGFVDNVDTRVALLALCGAVSGVSERVVPSLIRRVEDSLASNSSPSRQDA